MDISHYCEHFKNLKLTKTIEISQQSACRYCFHGKSHLWMCLSKNCGMFFCERNFQQHMLLHLQESRNKKGFHSIFINVLTARILCIYCQIQIYDLEQIKPISLEGMQDPFRFRLKVLPALIQLESQKNKMMGQLQNPEGHKKVNRGLTGFFGSRNNHSVNSAIQFLMQFSFYRDLLLEYSGKNKQLEELRKVFEKSEAADYRAISTDELTKLIIEQNPDLRGYSRKDPFEHVLMFMTMLHQRIKFYSVEDEQEKCDQWEFLGKPGLTSLVTLNCPLFDNLSSTLSLNYECPQCKATQCSLANINFLKINFPKKKRKAKEVEKQLAEHRVSSPIKNRRNSLMNLFMPQQDCPFTVQQLIIQFLKQPLHKDRQCKECKKALIKKKIHFSHLSQYIIIQINRMNKDGNSIDSTALEFSQDPIDFGPFTQNKQQQLLYQFQACICIQKGCLFPVIGKSKSNKQAYIFKNQIVTMLRTQKLAPNPYVLCFKRKRSEQIISKAAELYHKISFNNLSSESMEHNYESGSHQYPLPDFFTTQLKHNIFPSLCNPLVCHHNYLKPSLISKMARPIAISAQFYEQIISMFFLLSPKGLSHMKEKKNYMFTSQICQYCSVESNKVQKRRHLERNKILELEKLGQKNGGCMVSSDWIKRWVNFLYKKGEYGYMNRGYPMPGPIDNKMLLESSGKCKSNLKKGEDYKVISIFIWRLLKDLYGGGPQIRYKWKKAGLNQSEEETIKEIKNSARQIKDIFHIEVPDSPKKSIIIEKSSSYVDSNRAKEEEVSD